MQNNIDKDLFDRAISGILLNVKPVRQNVSDSTTNFLNKYLIPNELRDVLVQNSFDRSFKIGHIYYYKTNDIERENLEEENVNCIREGLLIVGSGLNGDPVVIDIKSLRMGFVFHDELWENSSVKARSIYIDTGLSFGQFYFGAATQVESFPVDGYQAKKLYS